MTKESPFTHNPKLDLVLERSVDVPPSVVWKAWTEPEHLKKWFVPKPWTLADCRVDLRPGGEFFTDMRSPEGQSNANAGCFLEVVPEKRLTWTSAMTPGFRPVAPGEGNLLFTAVIMIEPSTAGTKYTATAIHANEAARNTHHEMGFEMGWGSAFEQLVAAIKAGDIS